MRLFLILLCLIAMVATAWHAVFKGTDFPHMSGAPQIEDRVAAEVFDAVVPLATGSVDIEVDGRSVNLTGSASSETEHASIVAAVRAVPLVERVTSEMKMLETASPFLLTIEKATGGALTLTGYMPDARTEGALLDTARATARGAKVSARLKIAAGVPEGDWAGMVKAGLAALDMLEDGTLTISDAAASLSGMARDISARDAAAATVANAPMGTWTFNVAGAAPEGGFRFAAMKAPDGTIVLDGHAPDEGIRGLIVAAAAKLTADPVGGTLEIATGMPDPAWPERVLGALKSLEAAASGIVTVSGDTVSLTAEVETERDVPALQALVQQGWDVTINVLNPIPDADVLITLDGAGRIAASGLMPEGLSPEAITAALPGADVGKIDLEERGRAADWQATLEGLGIVLPRFRVAAARLVGTKLMLKGSLARGYSAEGIEASLRTVMARNWELTLELTERPPLAEVTLTRREGAVTLAGVLPLGLTPEDALVLLGDGTRGDALASGGDGDPDAWRKGLAALAQAFGLFADADGKLTEGRIELSGKLRPGYAGDLVQPWLIARLPEGWKAGLSVEELPPADGDRRVNLATGREEVYRGAFWLPELDFPVSVERCTAEVAAVLGDRKITFVTGSAFINDDGRELLDPLAAVAVRCLVGTALGLEISGHTDSVGNDRSNQRLSQARAEAVMEAMVERGAPAGAVTAVGRGEAEPIASNDTLAGRRANRRIVFRWIGGDDGTAAGRGQ